MKYVPSLPPLVTGTGTRPDVAALAGIRRVNPVRARTSPPLIVQQHVRHETDRQDAANEERRHDPHPQGERRTYCRRTEHHPVLIELRSGRERRRHNQRAVDVAEHIDVEA